MLRDENGDLKAESQVVPFQDVLNAVGVAALMLLMAIPFGVVACILQHLTGYKSLEAIFVLPAVLLLFIGPCLVWTNIQSWLLAKADHPIIESLCMLFVMLGWLSGCFFSFVTGFYTVNYICSAFGIKGLE